jgi:hypothetical protein
MQSGSETGRDASERPQTSALARRASGLSLTAAPAALAPKDGSLCSKQAYLALSEERAALRESELLVLNLDVVRVVTTLLGVLPRLEALAPRLAQCLPELDQVQFGKLRLYTYGLLQAEALRRAAFNPGRELPALTREAVALRRDLLVHVRPLVLHGLIDASRLANLRQTTRYEVLVFDLHVLALVLREAWPRLAGKTALTPEMIARADELAVQIGATCRTRPEPGPEEHAVDQVRRSFTLLMRAYDEARHGVLYLRRREGDAERFAPSLYRRHKKRAKNRSAPEAPQAPSQGADPQA